MLWVFFCVLDFLDKSDDVFFFVCINRNVKAVTRGFWDEDVFFQEFVGCSSGKSRKVL